MQTAGVELTSVSSARRRLCSSMAPAAAALKLSSTSDLVALSSAFLQQ